MCILCDVIEKLPKAPGLSIKEALKSWENARQAYHSFLRDIGLGFEIDEIAIHFPARNDMGNWIIEAVKEEGVELFNTAQDRVMTTPFGTEYAVEYCFLRMPSEMRVEAMTVLAGFSPLHMALEGHSNGEPIVVHFSFKCEDPNDYEYALSVMSQSERANLVQGCDSAYGRFSYWNVPELSDTVASIYLKPRVNLRDRGEFGMPTVGGGIAEGHN